MLIKYLLTLKERLQGDVWPLGYSNDDFTYVPTKRAVYEGGDVIVYTSSPGPPKPDTEDCIVETALALAERVGARRTKVSSDRPAGTVLQSPFWRLLPISVPVDALTESIFIIHAVNQIVCEY